MSSSFRYDLMTAYDLGIKSQGLGQPRPRAGQPLLRVHRDQGHRRARGRGRAGGCAAAGVKLEAMGSTPPRAPAGPLEGAPPPILSRCAEGDSRPARPGLIPAVVAHHKGARPHPLSHRRRPHVTASDHRPRPSRHAGSGQARARPADRRRSRVPDLGARFLARRRGAHRHLAGDAGRDGLDQGRDASSSATSSTA